MDLQLTAAATYFPKEHMFHSNGERLLAQPAGPLDGVWVHMYACSAGMFNYNTFICKLTVCSCGAYVLIRT